jgi:hypothetical protein
MPPSKLSRVDTVPRSVSAVKPLAAQPKLSSFPALYSPRNKAFATEVQMFDGLRNGTALDSPASVRASSNPGIAPDSQKLVPKAALISSYSSSSPSVFSSSSVTASSTQLPPSLYNNSFGLDRTPAPKAANSASERVSPASRLNSAKNSIGALFAASRNNAAPARSVSVFQPSSIPSNALRTSLELPLQRVNTPERNDQPLHESFGVSQHIEALPKIFSLPPSESSTAFETSPQTPVDAVEYTGAPVKLGFPRAEPSGSISSRCLATVGEEQDVSLLEDVFNL